MAINWEMGVSDPMKGINTGLASLTQGLQAQQERERQARLDAMAMELHNTQLQKEQIGLSDLTRQSQQADQLRTLLATPQTTPAVSNVAPAQAAGLQDLPGMGQFMPRTPAPFPQQQVPLSPTAQGSAASAGNINAGVTPETQASPEKITYDFLRTTDPQKAADYRQKILDNAKEIAKAGDHAGAIKMVNETLGTNLNYLGSKDSIMAIANGDGTHILYDVATGKSMALGTPKPTTLAQGATLVDPTTGKVIASGEKKSQLQIIEIPSADGKSAQKFSVDLATGVKTPIGEPYKVKSQVTNVNVGGGTSGMSGDAVTLAANNYLLTGQLPAMGMGGAAQKMIILNKAAQLAKDQGIDARDIQGQIAGLKADSGALKNDEKQYDLMHKAELQAQGAAKLLRASSANYGRTNVKFVNSLEALGREAVNDPKLADLQMKLLAFGREYYKVTTNAYASASELSIGAQAAADKMLNASSSYAALEAKINAAEQEMGNTNKTFLQTIAERKGKISSKGSGTAPKGGVIRYDAQGNRI